MKVVVQNLQKRKHLGGDLIDQFAPDVLLVQEINYHSEEPALFPACFVSMNGYGTAIHSKWPISNVRKVASPHAEFGGLIYKKTTIATIDKIDVVSFHGYNGQPWKNVENLLDHVKAVLEKMCATGPAVFAGDFNTWTSEHVTAVTELLKQHGFDANMSWPYANRPVPLDHVYVRKLTLVELSVFENESDHRGAEVTIKRVEN